ncbi:hypothetical protein, partial [Aeromonas veronii]|uniref:hypothetical protein n=1 Tax=Aeromonas veronii TaxID=654 RepID=UPI001F38C779
APTPVEPPLPETLVNSVLSISFNTPDCLIVTIGTVCENQDTSLGDSSIGSNTEVEVSSSDYNFRFILMFFN